MWREARKLTRRFLSVEKKIQNILNSVIFRKGKIPPIFQKDLFSLRGGKIKNSKLSHFPKKYQTHLFSEKIYLPPGGKNNVILNSVIFREEKKNTKRTVDNEWQNYRMPWMSAICRWIIECCECQQSVNSEWMTECCECRRYVDDNRMLRMPAIRRWITECCGCQQYFDG